jgi:hypothetical protein
VYHQSCLKEELHEHIGFVCSWCKIFQTIAAEYDKAGDRAKVAELNSENRSLEKEGLIKKY